MPNSLQRRLSSLLVLAAVVCAAAPVFAQGTPPPTPPPQAPAAPAAPAEPAAPAVPSDLKSAFLRNWDDVSAKLLSLAEAVPAEKYTWRPAEGVRSVAEVFTHVAGGNYFLPRALGAEMPAGLSRDMQKETDKTKVVEMLRASIAHARAAVDATSQATLLEEVELFGRKMTRADALLALLSHSHEHLGQAIAYARSNAVVPPWSQAEQ